MAKKAKQVYGVEIVPQAIDDAKRNAAINDIHNAEFYVGKAEEVLPQTYEREHIHADIIVVDPPRKAVTRACWHVSHKCSQSGWSMSAAIRPHWPEILSIWKKGIIRSKRFSVLICSALGSCGDCGCCYKGKYVEILEFTHFVEFFSFRKIGENHKEKSLVKK